MYVVAADKNRHYSIVALGAAALLLVVAMWAMAGSGAPRAAAQDSSPAGGGSPTATPCAGVGSWEQVASPNPPDRINILYGVDATSANDAWAVGIHWPEDGSVLEATLIEHWDGTSWTVVPSPNPTYRSTLRAVSALAPNDVWAVGYMMDAGYGSDPLILHWDGASWTVMPAPEYGDDYVYLFGVAAVSPDDVWAVGRRSYASQSTIILHWDGVKWSESLSGRIPGCLGVPYPCAYYSVTALSANDAWAVGAIHEGGYSRTLTVHWNGSVWTRIASPNAGSFDWNVLRGVSAVAPNDVWAAGHYDGPSAWHTLTMHWNGSSWAIVPSPSPGSSGSEGHPDRAGSARTVEPDGGGGTPPPEEFGDFIYGVAAAASNEVWAVGTSNPRNSLQSTLILRWNGTSWTQAPSASPSASYNVLQAVGTAGPGDAWSAGAYEPELNTWHTLIERYSAQACGTPVPTPSGTPPTATRTRTNTPTATATVCGVTDALVEGFENGGVLGTQFTSNVGSCQSGGCGWSANADEVRTGAYSAFAPDLTDVSDQRLVTTNPISIPSGANSATLSFWHLQRVDYGDGGVLEVSTNSGINWNDAGPNITQGGYDALLGGANNPLAGRQGWSRYDQGSNFSRVAVNLLSYAGQDLLFRIRMGTNNAIGSLGWWVDDIVVTIDTGCNPGTPAPTNTPVPPAATSTSTAVPSTPTATAVPNTPTSTSTPGAPPEACEMDFTDVGSGDYFYHAVHELYCMNAVSGYSDHTFRPYLNTTRGQLAKIVVLAQGWSPDTAGAPHFTDVPPSDPFYAYIETAYNRNVISGYGDNTFRAYSDVTRGQLCKIAVTARGWGLDTAGAPHFTDVPPSDPFYTYIETAYNRGIITGYSGNTFRPTKPATRGQIAKILYGAMAIR
jgi:hypothetical protein